MGPTWAFVDALMPSGAAVSVVDPRKTRLKAGYAAKTDRLDARRLADALRRDSIVSVYVPSPAVRELREVCRGRYQVVRLRARVAQMIRALLLRSGHDDVPVTRVFSSVAWRGCRRCSCQPRRAPHSSAGAVSSWPCTPKPRSPMRPCGRERPLIRSPVVSTRWSA
jgi:transposase